MEIYHNLPDDLKQLFNIFMAEEQLFNKVILQMNRIFDDEHYQPNCILYFRARRWYLQAFDKCVQEILFSHVI